MSVPRQPAAHREKWRWNGPSKTAASGEPESVREKRERERERERERKRERGREGEREREGRRHCIIICYYTCSAMQTHQHDTMPTCMHMDS